MNPNTLEHPVVPDLTQAEVNSAIAIMDQQLDQNREYGANAEKIDAEHARLLAKPVVKHLIQPGHVE